MPRKIETYAVTPAQIGNSRGYRIDAALFQAHPELREGSFEATYVGEGTLLLRPRTPESSDASDTEDDPVAAAYLAWTARVMTDRPDLLRPMTERELDLAEALVEGVPVDLDRDRLPDDFELP
jgi:hypothetical protein